MFSTMRPHLAQRLAPLRRHLSHSLPRSPPQSLESPTYPGLFYHPLPSPPNSYALSFLPTPAPIPSFSPTTIGILSPSKFGKQAGEGEGPPPLLPRNFEENGDFVLLLHELLRGSVPLDMGMQTLAMIRKSGYMHLSDGRNPPDPNRVPDPSDIIASFLIVDGKITPESYERSRTHRLVSMDGMMKLESALMERVRVGLERARDAEVGMARQMEEEPSTTA